MIGELMKNKGFHSLCNILAICMTSLILFAGIAAGDISKPYDRPFAYEDFGNYSITNIDDNWYFVGYGGQENNINAAIINNAKSGKHIFDIDLLEHNITSRVLIDSKDKYTIATFDGLELMEGYVLNAQQVDAEFSKIIIELTKDGKVVDTEIITPNTNKDVYVYDELNIGNIEDVPIIIARIDDIFIAENGALVDIEGLFQISDVPTLVGFDETGNVEIIESDGDVWYNRGVALYDLGQYEDAIKAYNKAIDINPNDADAWYNIGIILSKLEQYEKAIAAYDKAIAINPDNADAWQEKGNALIYLNRYDESDAAFEIAGSLSLFYLIINFLFSDVAFYLYFVMLILVLIYLTKKIFKPSTNISPIIRQIRKTTNITKTNNFASKSDSPPSIGSSPIFTSAFSYKGATIQYKVKVENPTSEPIADIKVNLYVPDVFLVSESTKTIPMLKPSESKTVTFEIRPTGECGDCEVSGKVVYYDYSTKKTTGIDIPPKSLSIVCPMLKGKEIAEPEWHSIVSNLIETEESTREIDMPAETLFTMASRIVKDMHMHRLEPEITNTQQLYNGVARFYGEGVKGLKYAAQVEVVGGAKKSRLILKTWAEKEEALTGFYHGLLDEIEKRVPVKGYIDDSIVQNFYHYGDKIGTQVKDSIVQRSNIGAGADVDAGAGADTGAGGDVAEKKCSTCGTVAEGNGKYCNGCGGKL